MREGTDQIERLVARLMWNRGSSLADVSGRPCSSELAQGTHTHRSTRRVLPDRPQGNDVVWHVWLAARSDPLRRAAISSCAIEGRRRVS
jgi:hypothetical protein